jgi:hypothetical protein
MRTIETRPRRTVLLVAAGVWLAGCAGGSEAADDGRPASTVATDGGAAAAGQTPAADQPDVPDGDGRDRSSTASSTEAASAETDVPERESTTTTTTTLPPTTTTTLPPTTTTIPEPARMPLTGVPLAYGQQPPDRPAMVVKIDNAPPARPQSGFNNADIVFEEIVNDSLTRFALVFHSHGSDADVGPIRSGRIQDVDLFASYAAPSFVWSGGNATVENAIANSGMLDLKFGSRGLYEDPGRRAPHAVFGNLATLWENTQPWQGRPGLQFAYRMDGEAPIGTPAVGVDVVLDSVGVRWLWDPTTGTYRREMDGEPHYDATTGQVTTHNVVVLVMNYAQGVSDSPDAQSIGYGEAFVFTGGNSIHGAWIRQDRFAPFTLIADDGSPIELTPGRTFIELPRGGTTFPIF